MGILQRYTFLSTDGLSVVYENCNWQQMFLSDSMPSEAAARNSRHYRHLKIGLFHTLINNSVPSIVISKDAYPCANRL